jgi:uncharacterized protein
VSAELVVYLARHLVDDAEAVTVDELERDGELVVRLHVAEEDRGKVIGRRGRMAQALRTVVRAAGARDNRRILLEIAD